MYTYTYQRIPEIWDLRSRVLNLASKPRHQKTHWVGARFLAMTGALNGQSSPGIADPFRSFIRSFGFQDTEPGSIPSIFAKTLCFFVALINQKNRSNMWM